MFSLSITICQKFSIEMFWWPWPWPLEWVDVKYKYGNGKAFCDFLFIRNCNVCHMSPFASNSQTKCAWPSPWPFEGSKSNINMPMERLYETFYLLAIATFALSIAFASGPRSNVNKPIKMTRATFCVGNSSLAVCEIITLELFSVLDSNLYI